MDNILIKINEYIGLYNQYIGVNALLMLLVPIGIYFSIKSRFIHLFKIGTSFKLLFGKKGVTTDKGDINHFKALTTALSATVGTGNIVGVALAIYYGGYGAIFWMWVTGFLGMAIKLAECTLANKYRVVNTDGTISGGPMYYIRDGLKNRLGKNAGRLAFVFAVGTALCSLGTGNLAQANSMSTALTENFGVNNFYSSITIALLSFIIISGGLKRVANITSRLVPFMAGLYILFSLIVIFLHIEAVPHTLARIVRDAFTGTAATGGFVGSAFIMSLTYGIQRGLFSNEAGQGSAPIAHAAAKTSIPAREGLVGSLEPLIDTLIICTMTALVILVTGAWESGEKGFTMTLTAFNNGLDGTGLELISNYVVTIALILFAFSTIIAWSYYGTRAVNFLWGEKYIKHYYILYAIFVFFGGVWGLDLVWNFVDMVITFMTIPNLIALLLLSNVVVKELKKV